MAWAARYSFGMDAKLIKRRPWPCTLITGASSGLGWSLALQLAQAGTHVIALARDRARLSALVEAAGPMAKVSTWEHDLGDESTLAVMAKSLIDRHPDLACIIHNAGIQHDRQMVDAGYGFKDIGDELRVNLAAPMQLTHLLLPHLLARPQARIVNITSGLAYAPKPSAAVYAASKAGLSMFSKALRLQLAGSSVQVHEVVLPLVDTPMTAGRGRKKMLAEQAASLALDGLQAGQQTVFVGVAQAIPVLQRWMPGLLQWLMAR